MTSKPHSSLDVALEEARQLCARSDTFRDYPEFKLARALLDLEEQLETAERHIAGLCRELSITPDEVAGFLDESIPASRQDG